MTLPAPIDRSGPAAPTLGLLRVGQSEAYHYLVSTPPRDKAMPDRRWPLIIFLHGVAERGTDVRDVVRQGVPKLLGGLPLTPEEAAAGGAIAERFVVVAPQCARDEVWDEVRLLALLDTVAREHPVDARRVYLTGLSMGGFGVWSLGIRHAERFAAIVPICGGGRVKDVTAAASNQPDVLRQLGIWAFHGAADRVVPLEESERMIEAVKRAGVADVKFTVYAEGAHDAWTRAYADPELYAWLLRHARNGS